MRQFNQAVEKNGFTHKDAEILVRGKLAGTANAPVLEVSGTRIDTACLRDAHLDIVSLLGKTVTVSGVIPQAPKGKGL